nr:DUF4169 family protein [Acuticoccus mangrovi]
MKRARKRRAREAAKAEAAESRIRHGRTAAQKVDDRSTAEKRDAQHEGHRLDRPD